MSMSASRSKAFTNLTREHSLFRVPGSSAADKLTLASLPDELLTLIVAELDLRELLTIRRVCRSLQTASGSRGAWRSVYLRCLGETLPRPFFLPKPIKECSAKEIEYSLRRWHTEWPPAGVMHQVKRSIVNGPPKESYAHPHSMVVTPGGRWVMTGYADGSVWCFDLSDNLASTADVEPFLLLPSTHIGVSVSNPNVQVLIAIDYTSDEAAGTTSETHHLTRFNMAVVTCPLDYRSTGAYTHINIWRVHLPEDKEETTRLVLGNHLSSFKDSGSGKLLSCSLYDKVVAYSMKSPPSRCTVIVDWEEANGKNEDQGAQRWYIPEEACMNIILLPGDRILTTHIPSAISLYNWRLNCPSSTLSPRNQQLEHVPSPWARRRLGSVCGKAIPSFFIVRDTIRLVIPTAYELFTLTIPKESHDPSMIKFESLVKGHSGVLDLTLGFGYDRGAGVVYESSAFNLFFTRYRWKDDSPLLIEEGHRQESTFTEYDATDPDLQNAGRVLYDQFSNRLFAFDASVSYVLTLVNCPPPDAPVHSALPTTEPETAGDTPTESESPAQVEPTEPPTPSDKPPTPIPNDSGSQSKEENPALPTVPSGPIISSSEGELPVSSKIVALPTILESSAHAEENVLTTSGSDPGAHLEPNPTSGPSSGDRTTPDAASSDHEEEEVEDESEAEKEVVDAVSILDGAKEKDIEGVGGAEKDSEGASEVEREER